MTGWYSNTKAQLHCLKARQSLRSNLYSRVMCKIKLWVGITSFLSFFSFLVLFLSYLIRLPLFMDSHSRVCFWQTQPRSRNPFLWAGGYYLSTDCSFTVNVMFKWMDGMAARQVESFPSSVPGVHWEWRPCDEDWGLWSHTTIDLSDCWLCW